MANVNIIPIKAQKNGSKTIITREDMNDLTLKDLHITEADLEEFIRSNIDVLFPDEGETLLVVGQQVRNKELGRADLVAIDAQGNIVLIELKRDKDDIITRKEAFEFQAIRYAANYALINTPQDLVQKLFAPYIEKHKSESNYQEDINKGFTASELAYRIVSKFLDDNQSKDSFNRKQRIILIASQFDLQTLSACAWLAKNGIDIRCLTVLPIEHNKQNFFQIEQIIPPPTLEEYFVEVAESISPTKTTPKSTYQSRKTMPRMAMLFKWGVIDAGDILYIRGHELETAEAVDSEHVKFQGKQIVYNEWGKLVTKWSVINIYEWTIQDKSKKTLHDLRREKMEEIEAIEASTIQGSLGESKE